MRGHCHLASITGIGHFRLPGRMDGIPTLPVLHGLREPNAPSQILGGVSDPARVCTAHKCDSLGRRVSAELCAGLFYPTNASSNALASRTSAMSKLSENQP